MRVVICDDNPIERNNLLEIATHISKSEGYDAEFEVFETAKQCGCRGQGPCNN